jgi:CBS domain-containing protein
MSATTTHYHGSYLMPAIEHATVGDAMHPGVLCAEPDATMTELARLMATHHVHCLVVMGISHERGFETLVWGIVTDVDVLEAGIGGGAEETAATLARQPILTAEPSMPLSQAAELMHRHGAAHILVVDPRAQRPVGVLSTLDVAGVLAWGEA